jgi:hypothetical protein
MLYKAILHGKEKRKMYRGGKAISYHCRNHGGGKNAKRNKHNWECEWCKGNRLHSNIIREEKYK